MCLKKIKKRKKKRKKKKGKISDEILKIYLKI